MFDATNIDLLAESGVAPFTNAYLFTGMEIVSTGTSVDNPSDKEQIILTTNNGLFRSNADQTTGNGIISAQNKTAAQWTQLPAGNTQPYWGIAGTDAPIPSTVWPITIQDQSGYATYERSSIEQISAGIGASFNDFVPTSFNALSTNAVFDSIDPITHFWSDGARRFFIINKTNDSQCINKLLSFPYNTTEWNVVNPGQHILFDPTIKITQRFYWVHHIGASGILMAGTDSGVIALE